MSEFGWTRLAYLSVVLTVIALLVKLGTFTAGSIPEDFPQSALAFAQRELVSGEDLDWVSRKNREARADERSAAPRPEAATAPRGEEHDRSSYPVESVYENVDFREGAPVFFRPAPRVGGASQNPSSTGAAGAKSCQTLADAPSGSKILFPLAREYFDSYEDTWGAARPQGGHEGADMMAPMGTPEYAVTDGTVVPVSGSDSNGWNTLGGYAVMIEAAYSVGPVKKGDLFYYAHMDRKSDLQIGDTVKAGDVVGYAGDTGEGPEGTRGLFPSHLHLGWYETSGERTQLASGAMNPYPLLEWIKANGGSIKGGSDVPYCEAPQPATPTPADGGYWQFPSDPGVRPDMSTETGTAAPSPVVEQNASSEFSPEIPREKRRPAKPDRPAEPEPPKDTEEPTEPPRNGEPSFPNLPNPLPGVGGIGDGIRDWIGGIVRPGDPANPRPSERPEPTAPAPPPKETTDPAPPPEEATPGDTLPPEATTPGDAPPEETTPEATNPGEDPEREPRGELREHEGEEESNEDSHPDEDCHEETAPSEEPPPEDTTSGEDTSTEESTSEETVEDPAAPPTEQYEPEEAGVQTESPELPGTSPVP